MRKLLVLFGMIGLSSSVPSIVVSNSTIDSNIVVNGLNLNSLTNYKNLVSLQDGPIDLVGIDLATIEIDTHPWTGVPPQEKTFLQSVLALNISSDSDNRDVLTDIIRDYSITPGNWIVTGVPSLWPEEGEIMNIETFQLIYIGASPIFSGVLTMPVSLFNQKVVETVNLYDYFSKDVVISEVFEDSLNDLNEKNIITKVFAENGVADWDPNDFYLENISYSGAILRAKDISKYTGSINLHYLVNIPLNWADATRVLHVDAYDSTQIDSDKIILTYHPALGKAAFLVDYSSLKFDVSGYTWDNNAGTNTISSQSATTKIGDTDVGVPIINLRNDNGAGGSILNRTYSKVNHMYVRSNLKWNWLGDNLTLTFDLSVEGYATWINAYWAKVEAQLVVDNFTLF